MQEGIRIGRTGFSDYGVGDFVRRLNDPEPFLDERFDEAFSLESPAALGTSEGVIVELFPVDSLEVLINGRCNLFFKLPAIHGMYPCFPSSARLQVCRCFSPPLRSRGLLHISAAWYVRDFFRDGDGTARYRADNRGTPQFLRMSVLRCHKG